MQGCYKLENTMDHTILGSIQYLDSELDLELDSRLDHGLIALRVLISAFSVISV